LEKISSTDYDSKWSTFGTVPAGGTSGQVLTKDSSTDYDTSWGTPTSAPDATTTTKGVVQLAGDLTGTAASPQIASGAIVDADINSGAKIAVSKLDTASSGQIIVANSSGVPAYVTASGDVSVASAGAVEVKTISNARALAYRNTTQSFTNNTDARITFSGVVTDPSTYWSAGAASRLTVPTGLGGLYQITYNLAFAANATGARYGFIWVNGGDLSDPLGVTVAAQAFASRFGATYIVNLSAGDYVQINARQTSGGALNLIYADLFLLRLDS
jgi:hypothetical protein